jgi:hypothetical protein
LLLAFSLVLIFGKNLNFYTPDDIRIPSSPCICNAILHTRQLRSIRTLFLDRHLFDYVTLHKRLPKTRVDNLPWALDGRICAMKRITAVHCYVARSRNQLYHRQIETVVFTRGLNIGTMGTWDNAKCAAPLA